ncbi:predicted protein [Verticillium alfalfae VaMs.102]|uniref:Predicted protein n=1 Tax=Verticillium alfalfae (strain VaMs.102 / ATCC MYA-4576 / FGSC 10136) TaxID=526221 RepID=C9SPS4_VERA1|nr:predicted protein [Verticillium alfalfae VaMs.102]EEY20789.1 predicted protein [Verticillium alfalfae VaMs.102]
MSDAGVDLWSATAVGVVKRKVRQQICEAWLEAVEVHLDGSREDGGKAKDEKSADGEDEDEDSDEEAEQENEAKDGSTTETDAVDDDDDKQTKEQQRQDLFTQWFFDIHLFECAFGPAADGASTASELAALGDKVYSHTGLDGAEARKRIAASSREHWRKTSLLFGLLA